MGITCMKAITLGSPSIQQQHAPFLSPHWHVESQPHAAPPCLAVRLWLQTLQNYLNCYCRVQRRRSQQGCLTWVRGLASLCLLCRPISFCSVLFFDHGSLFDVVSICVVCLWVGCDRYIVSSCVGGGCRLQSKEVGEKPLEPQRRWPFCGGILSVFIQLLACPLSTVALF